MAVIGGGYMWYSGQKVAEVVVPVSDAVTEVASDTAEVVTEAASDAAEVVTEVASDAVEAATDAASNAVEAVTDSATESVTEAVTEAVTEVVTGAVTDATSGTAGGVNDVFTVDGFDLGKVVEAVDASDLSIVQKTTLKAGLENAKDNPELLKAALGQIKGALGL